MTSKETKMTDELSPPSSPEGERIAALRAQLHAVLPYYERDDKDDYVYLLRFGDIAKLAVWIDQQSATLRAACDALTGELDTVRRSFTAECIDRDRQFDRALRAEGERDALRAQLVEIAGMAGSSAVYQLATDALSSELKLCAQCHTMQWIANGLLCARCWAALRPSAGA
jgi:hypothetical protein